MGQAVTKFFSLTTRELKSFNLERRAEKVISQEKPKPAPKHPSTVKELERLKEENVSTDHLYKKDKQLDEYLKKVYVTSPDPAPPMERKINPKRPLPTKRPTEIGISYGYSESEEAAVPEGKVSLKQSLAFISNHQNDPNKYSSAAIAFEYKLSLDDTKDILEHFKLLTVHVPKKEVDPESLSTYERLQHKIRDMTIYNSASVLKEMKKVYGDGESFKIGTRFAIKPEEKDKPIDVEKNNTGKTKGEAHESKGLKTEEGTEQEKTSLKPEDKQKKESTRKRSQENG